MNPNSNSDVELLPTLTSSLLYPVIMCMKQCVTATIVRHLYVHKVSNRRLKDLGSRIWMSVPKDSGILLRKYAEFWQCRRGLTDSGSSTKMAME